MQPDGTDAATATEHDARRAVAAVWRSESRSIVATLARVTRDVSMAEDCAQDALAAALEQWPRDGIPRNPAGWLTTAAKRRAIDVWRRAERFQQRAEELGRALEQQSDDDPGWDPDTIDDDVLRLVFTACHPVLGREAQVAMTLRVVGGLSSDEIARAFLVPTATVQQRIVRAKRTLAAAKVPFESPGRDEFAARLGAVMGVVYLIFNEGYAATSGDSLTRRDLADEALRIGRVLAALLPREAEAHALVALMELQASRFAARVDASGAPVLLPDQDRRRWDRGQITRGRAALAMADALGSSRGRGAYALQAAIAECHALASSDADTDWHRIVLLYEALGRIAPNPVVELSRAAAVAKAVGPASALIDLDALVDAGSLASYAPLHAVRASMLEQLGRASEARAAFALAASLTANERERVHLEARAAALA